MKYALGAISLLLAVVAALYFAAPHLFAPAAQVAREVRSNAVQQEERLFDEWRQGPPRGDVAALQAYLEQQQVAGIVPLRDILRNDARWRQCDAAPFAVPPRSRWPSIVPTLRYVRDHVIPAVGEVRVVSGYRDPVSNSCFRGAKASRHLTFAALDLEPRSAISRAELIRRLCPLHAATGARGRVGLGIYPINRFHIDTAGFRRWGADYRAHSSPCADGLRDRVQTDSAASRNP